MTPATLDIFRRLQFGRYAAPAVAAALLATFVAIPPVALGEVTPFGLTFDNGAGSLTEFFRNAADAPATSSTWSPDGGTGAGGGVLVGNPNSNALYFRPTPPENSTSSVNFGAADPGTTYTLSIDFRFFGAATDITTMTIGYAANTRLPNGLVVNTVPSMVAAVARSGSSGLTLRFRNNASNTAELSFDQSQIPSGHWFRLNLILTRNDVVAQFGYVVELFHLGADGTGMPAPVMIGGTPARVAGNVSNAALHASSTTFLGIHARRSAAANGGVTAFDNFTYSIEASELERFDWSETPEIYPGMRHAQLNLTSPRPLFLNVLRIDSHHPDIRFTVTGRHQNWGQQMRPPPFVTFEQDYFIRTGRQRTRDFLLEKRAQGVDAVAAINAAPWKPWAELGIWQSSFAYADQLGLTVSHGEVVDIGNNRPSLIVEKDWTLRMQETSPTSDITNVLHAVTGFQYVLQHGIPSGAASPEPRTGYGLCRNNRYLILLTADGRQNGFSEGLGHIEVGQFLRYFGAWTGINMDGGGSTTMVLRDPSSTNINIVNSPSESLRSVGANLAIYYVDAENPEEISLHDWFAFRRVPPELRGPLEDADGDGVPNILAYAFNIDRKRQGDARQGAVWQQLEITEENNTRFLNLNFRVNRHAVDLDVKVQLSQTLGAYSWSESPILEIVQTGTDPVTHDPIYRATTDATGFPRAFLRLHVESGGD